MLLETLASTGDHHVWWFLAPLWWALWIAVIVFVVWTVKRRGGWRRPDPLDRAREVLAERFARGELTADEYRERLGQLS